MDFKLNNSFYRKKNKICTVQFRKCKDTDFFYLFLTSNLIFLIIAYAKKLYTLKLFMLACKPPAWGLYLSLRNENWSLTATFSIFLETVAQFSHTLFSTLKKYIKNNYYGPWCTSELSLLITKYWKKEY